MTTLLLHATVLAVILGVPALDRWCAWHFHLSRRWTSQGRECRLSPLTLDPSVSEAHARARLSSCRLMPLGAQSGVHAMTPGARFSDPPRG